MEIRNIMANTLIWIKNDDTLCGAAKKMKLNGIGFLPVVHEKRIIGVITDRDIVVNGLANNCDADAIVEKYMHKDVVTVDIDASLIKALNIMAKEKISIDSSIPIAIKMIQGKIPEFYSNGVSQNSPTYSIPLK